MDKDFILSIIQTESSFDPNARGDFDAYGQPKAKGLMQLHNLVWEHYRDSEDSDIFNPEDNIRAGTRFLNHLYNKYNGDLSLVASAYNTGETNLDRALRDNRGIPNPEYVAKVSKHYQQRKARQQQQTAGVLAERENPTQNYRDYGDPDEFKNQVLNLVTDVSFNNLAPEDQLLRVDQLYNSRGWKIEVDPIYKDVVTKLRSQLPDEVQFDAVLAAGAAPYLRQIGGTNEKEILESAEQNKLMFYKNLEQKGVPPGHFGDIADKLFQRKANKEIYDSKGILSRTATFGSEVIQGALDVPRGAAAGALDWVFDDSESADAARNFATGFLGADKDEGFRYELDEYGRIAYDDEGQPITKGMGTFARAAGSVLGTVATFKAGAGMAALTGRSAGALSAVETLDRAAKAKGLRGLISQVGKKELLAGAGTVGAVNFFNNAGQAYQLAENHGATRDEAMEAALYASGTSFLNTAADVFISINPKLAWMNQLNGVNKAKAVAKLTATGVGMGVVTNVAEQAGVEYGVASALDGAYEPNFSNMAAAGAGGGVAAGALNLISGVRMRLPQHPTKPSTAAPGSQPFAEDVATPEVPRQELLGLPMPERFKEQVTGEPIPMHLRLPDDELARLADRLQAFKRGDSESVILNYDDITAVPPIMQELFNVDVVKVSDNQIRAIRRIPYEAPLATELTDINSSIENLQTKLANMIDPEQLPQAIARRNQIENQLAALDEKYGGTFRADVEARTKRINQLENNIARLEAQEVARPRRAFSEVRAAQRAENLSAARAELAQLQESPVTPTTKITNLEDVPRAAELVRELNKLNPQIQEALTDGYLDSYYNTNRMLSELNSTKLDVQYDQIYKDAKDNAPLKDFAVALDTPQGTRYAIQDEGNWYVVDRDGEPLTTGDRFLNTAIDNYSRRVDTPTELSQQKVQLTDPNRLVVVRPDEVPDIVQKLNDANATQAYKDRLYRAKLRTKLGTADKFDRDLLAARPKRKTKAKVTPKENVIDDDNVLLSSSEDTLYSSDAETIGADGVPPYRTDFENVRVAKESVQERIPLSTPKKPYDPNAYTKVDLPEPDKITNPINRENIWQEAAKAANNLAEHLVISTGGSRGQSGSMDVAHKFLHVKDLNDIPTAAEELFHAAADQSVLPYLVLDGKGQIVITDIPENIQDALIDQALTWYKGAKRIQKQSKPVQLHEGFANFLMHMGTNQPVRRDVLAWYKNEFSSNHASTVEAINPFMQVLQNYTAQDPVSLMYGFIRPKKLTKTEKLKEKVSDFFNLSKGSTRFYESEAILKEIDRIAGTEAGLIAQTKKYLGLAQAKSLVHSAITRPDGSIIKPYGLKDNFDGFTPKEFLDIEAYMAAQSLITRINRNPNYKKEQGVAEADANKAINMLATADPKIVKAANDFWADWTSILKGIQTISPTVHTSIQRMLDANLLATGHEHGFYVPFQRVGKSGFNPTMRATGSARGIDNPLNQVEAALGTMLQNAYYLQSVEQLAIAANQQHGSPLIGANVRTITNKERVAKLNSFFKNRVLEIFGDDNISDGDATALAHQMITMMGTGKLADDIKPADGFKLIVMPDPKKPNSNIYLEVSDRVMEGYSEATSELLDNPVVRATVTKPKNWLQSFATTWNPTFAFATNLPRDLMTSYRKYPLWSPAAWAGDMITGYKEMSLNNLGFTDKSQWAERAKHMGLLHSTMRNQELYDALQKSKGYDINTITGKTMNGVLAGVQNLANVMGTAEQAPRLAAMIQYFRSIGKGPLDQLTAAETMNAINAFRYATVNFTIAGTSIQNLNKVAPFARARMATVVQSIDDLRGLRGKVVQQKAIAELLGWATIGAAYVSTYGDEEWLREMPAELRSQTMYTPIDIKGQQYLIRNPLPDVASLGFALGQMVGSDPQGDGRDIELREWAGVALGDLMPVDARLSSPQDVFETGVSFTGPLFKHIIEQALNKDFFRGAPIESPTFKLSNAEQRERYYPHTTEMAKWLGDTLNWSPIRIEAAMKNFVAGPVNFMKAVEKQLLPEKLPNKDRGAIMDSIVDMYLYSSQQEAITFKSSELFYETLENLRMNKIYETPEENKLRLSLDAIQRDLSYTRLALNVPDITQKDRTEILNLRKDLFKQARERILGEDAVKYRSRYSKDAKRLREENNEAKRLKRQQQQLEQ